MNAYLNCLNSNGTAGKFGAGTYTYFLQAKVGFSASDWQKIYNIFNK